MGKCKRTSNLEVHHKNRAGGAVLSNAQVLCHQCHEQTGSFGKEGKSPPPFSDGIKNEALRLAGNHCTCNGCSACLN